MSESDKSARAKFLESLTQQFLSSSGTAATTQPELSRSLSAPPAEFLNSITSLIDDGENDELLRLSHRGDAGRGSSVTDDPSYAAFFYSNSRFDPRLPPPSFYSPGQSWQMWPTAVKSPTMAGGSAAVGSSLRARAFTASEQQGAEGGTAGAENESLSSSLQRKKLVDMIQEDFPRTPSPVYSASQLSSSATDMKATLRSTHDELVRSDGFPKQKFTISGSADAVLAAAGKFAVPEPKDAVSGLDEPFMRLGLIDEGDDDRLHSQQAKPWSARPKLNVNGGELQARFNALEPFELATRSSGPLSAPPSAAAPAAALPYVGKPNGHAQPYTPARPMPLQAAQAQPSNGYYEQSASGGYGRHAYQGMSHPAGYPQSYPQAQPFYPGSNGAHHGNAANPYSVPEASLLDEFRSNRNRKFELTDLRGVIVDFSTDQHGSRFIQQKLETASDTEKELVFAEIYPMALQLMTDVFGNYVIQKFFEFGTVEERMLLAQLMHGHVLSLSLQMYGCRVVQKALEHVPQTEQIQLVQELEGHVLRCVKDQNGNHVIQKCIECVPLSSHAPFLTAAFLSQASQLAMHPYGCRVIQRIFEHGPAEHTDALLDELLRSTGTLIQDQYGNYVIQHVLEKGKSADRDRILDYLDGRVLELSKHKFASNVVEKCVSYGNVSQRQRLVNEVLTPVATLSATSEDETLNPGGGVVSGEPRIVTPLHLMMRDQFANYVVQKMLDVVEGEPKEALLCSIKPQLASLRRYTYGKHILSKVERLLGLPPSDPDLAVQSPQPVQSRQHYSAPSTPRPSLANAMQPSPASASVRGSAAVVQMPGTRPMQAAKLADPNDFPPLGSSLPGRGGNKPSRR